LKKNSAYKEMIQRHYTRKAVENYKQLRGEEKTIHKKNKRIFQENILKEIEELNLHNETRRFYRMVNKMRKEFKPRISACRKKEGEMINNKREILERWNQYFQELLEGKEENDETDNLGKASKEHQDNQGGTNLPTVHELEEAIYKLNNNKASGLDNINAELIESSKPVLINMLLKIIQKVWETETIPQE
jgi:mannitol-1-phosphate/altronate dehydrogenase